MPELPEVETIIRGLKQQILNLIIVDVKIYYKPMIKPSAIILRKTLVAASIINILRHGKYMFLSLSNQMTLVWHLRMTGQLLVVEKNKAIDKHTHIEIIFKDHDKKLIYRDIRKFGTCEIIKTSSIKEYIENHHLGQDSLEIDYNSFKSLIKKKKKPIKSILLDQTVLAGIGNIYADEILIRASVFPLKHGYKLKDNEIQAIFKEIKPTLQAAIIKKGTSFSDYINSIGQKGKFQLHLRAYQQQGKPCFRCKSIIKKIKVGGRGTYYCPNCQK